MVVTGEADLLIGADGIHKSPRARKVVFGPDSSRASPPASNLARGLVPDEKVAHLGIESGVEQLDASDGHVVHY